MAGQDEKRKTCDRRLMDHGLGYFLLVPPPSFDFRRTLDPCSLGEEQMYHLLSAVCCISPNRLQ